MSKQSGFSLIELMITVTILTLVTSIALPSYQQHVKRSHRVDAKAALLLVAAEQEKYYIQNNAYTTTLSDLNITGTLEGYYDLSISSTNTTSDFTATATPDSSGPQATDTHCTSFTLDSSGNAAATNGSSDTTDICW